MHIIAGSRCIQELSLTYLAQSSDTTMTAANRVYRNDDIVRVLVQHCAKRSLVSLMRVEKKGTIYDSCVKELYKEVDYEVVKDMLRDTVSHLKCQVMTIAS